MVAVLSQVPSRSECRRRLVSVSPDLCRKIDGKPRHTMLCSGAGLAAAGHVELLSGGVGFSKFAGVEDYGHSDA